MTYPATPDRHTVRDSAWRDRAKCNGHDDPEWFYPNPTVRDDRLTPLAREVKAYCADCPAIAECLDDALATEDWHGIRGGLTGEERRNLARRARRAQLAKPAPPPIDHGTPRGWQQHHSRREEPCGPCLGAMNAKRERDRRELLKTRHGSVSGYTLHRRLDEPACPACLAAQAASSEAARQRRKANA